jgi:circadian clock protein KaiC
MRMEEASMAGRVGNELTLGERVPTGIDGLDDILGGGLPKNHLYLVEGESGSGKTTLGLHFLLDGHRRGERGLWITMAETAQELQQAARRYRDLQPRRVAGGVQAGREILVLLTG